MAQYKLGVQAFGKGRYKDAVDYFLAADRIAKSASFAYNAMLAYEQMGDSAQALRWGREYLRRKPDARDADDVKRRDAGFEQALQKKGVQQLTVLSNVEGATATVDDTAVGVTPWTGELPPGNHRLALQKRGYRDGEIHFLLADAHAMDVRLDLAALADTTPPPAATAPSPVLPIVMWSGYGLAGAGLIIATATGGASLAKQRTIASQCVDHRCSADLQPEHDQVIALANASNAFFGLAAAGAVTGTVALVLRLQAAKAEPASARVEPLVGPGFAGVAGAFE